jgi:hypothetical protein
MPTLLGLVFDQLMKILFFNLAPVLEMALGLLPVLFLLFLG